MRDLNELNRYRVRTPDVISYIDRLGTAKGGCFVLRSPIDNKALRIVASIDSDWDHVSISLANRTPKWSEMEYVKRRFFRDDEVAMQLHVTPAEHVNVHPFCLHLWRPHNIPIPLPPAGMV